VVVSLQSLPYLRAIRNVGIELCFIAFGWWFIARKHLEQSETWAAEEGYRVETNHFRRFTYMELRKATKSFKDEFGHGRYGSVYKGMVRDKHIIVVKKIKNIRQGEDEFETVVSVCSHMK
jgi:hypothetical protein